MKRSDDIAQLATALAAAQAEIKRPERNKTVEVKTRTGSNYEFSYATLDAIIEGVRGPLTKNGLWFSQTLEQREGDPSKYHLVTTLLHSSGQYIASETPLIIEPGGGNQQFGSALTFMRRYALQSLLGVAADTDDDANAADGNEAKIQDRKPKPSPIEPPKPTALMGETPFVIARNEGMDWIAWGKTFLDHVKQSKTTGDSAEWLKLNKDNLERMKTEAAKAHGRLCAAIFDHDTKITGALNASG